MNFLELLNTLSDNLGKNLKVELDGQPIPEHFHLTEVGFMSGYRIDCGGFWKPCHNINLQLWTADDLNHRLSVDKVNNILSNIIETDFIEAITDWADIYIEYGSPISLYVITNFYLEDNNLLLVAEKTATDCPAKDKCGIEGCC